MQSQVGSSSISALSMTNGDRRKRVLNSKHNSQLDVTEKDSSPLAEHALSKSRGRSRKVQLPFTSVSGQASVKPRGRPRKMEKEVIDLTGERDAKSSKNDVIDLTSDSDGELKNELWKTRLTWKEKGKDPWKKEYDDWSADDFPSRCSSPIESRSVEVKEEPKWPIDKDLTATSSLPKKVKLSSQYYQGSSSPPALRPAPPLLPAVQPPESSLVPIKYENIGEYAIWEDAPATYMPRGPIQHFIDNTNMPNERCFCMVGRVRRSYLTRAGTGVDDDDIPPASVLQSIEIDLEMELDKFHNRDNEETIRHPFGALSREVLDKHIQQGYEAALRLPSGTPLTPSYRLPFTEEGFIRFNTDSVFVFGPPNFGPTPSSLEQRALRQGMAYRFPGGVDKNVTITDGHGMPVDREDVGAGDIVMVEYLNRPYNFTGSSGNVVQGHKLKLMSITRIKRRLRDLATPVRSRNVARASRAPRVAF